MTQTWRFPIILALSVLLGMQALRDMMMFSGDLFSNGATYLAALGLAWFGVSAIFSLLDHYVSHNQAELDRIALEEMELALDDEDATFAAAPDLGVKPPRAAAPAPSRATGANRESADNLAGQGSSRSGA